MTPDSERFVRKVSSAFKDVLRVGEDLTPAMGRIENWLKVGIELLERLAVEQPPSPEHIEQFLEHWVAFPLMELLGNSVRVRIYRIDNGTNSYQGFLTYGMPRSFEPSFGAKRLSVVEPPYDRIEGLSCLRLTAKAVGEVYRENPEVFAWYRDELGLGTLTPETYTWHLDHGSPAPWPLAGESALAVSIDLGQDDHRPRKRNSQPDRIIAPVLVRMLDCLFVGSSYGREICRLLLGPKHPSESRTDVILPKLLGGDKEFVESVAIPIDATISTRSHAQGQRPASNVQDIPVEDLEKLFIGEDAAFIPAGEGGQPWVFWPGEEQACEVNNLWNEACALKRPNSLYLLGPSGSGKELLARAVHSFSHPRGPFRDAHFPGTISEASCLICGVEDNVFTDVRRRRALAEEAEYGTVFFDEWINHLILYDGLMPGMLKWLEALRCGYDMYHRGSERPWRPNALVILGGKIESFEALIHTDFGRDFERRGELQIRLPGWGNLSLISRLLLIRHFVLKATAQSSLRGIEVPLYLLGSFASGESMNADIVRSCLGGFDNYQPEQPSSVWKAVIMKLRHRGFDFGDRLTFDGPTIAIGQGSPFEGRLTEVEKLIRRVAECRNCSNNKGGCIREEILRSCTGQIADEQGLLDLHYLLLAGARYSPPGSDDTRFRSGPQRFQGHFESRTAYGEAIARLLPKIEGRTARPSDLIINGPNGEKYPYGRKLFQHVETSAARLQAKVERIALAYPPFFHYVPYWARPIERIRGHEEPEP